MIRNIVFDMGNVLVRYTPAKFVEQFTTDPQQQNLLLKEIFQSVEWVQADRGTITKEEMERHVCSRLPEALQQTAKEIVQHWYEKIEPIHEMESIITHLKAKGYGLYILSNAPSDFYSFTDKIPCADSFDGMFVSSDWKMLKPESVIYRTFCHHFQLVPAQCYFVDDLTVNVEGAINMGMQGCVFNGDMQELMSNFKEAGIQI